MSRVVWKFSLSLDERQVIEMPEGAQIILVTEQHGHLCAWAIVNTRKPPELRYLTVVGTGHIVPPGDYLGSVLSGPYVWHVFEEPT